MLYPHTLPRVGDVVMVKFAKIEGSQAYCNLLEYDEIEGVLNGTEISKKKVYNIKKHVKIGKTDCLHVLSVDLQKGYIDLSKKNVKPDEITECKTRYLAAKRTIGVLKKWSETLDKDLTEIAFERYCDDEVDVYIDLHTSSDWISTIGADVETSAKILNDYEKLYAVKPKKYELSFEMSSFEKDGAQIISSAIKQGVSCRDGITCVYTGKIGKAGSVYTLSMVSESSDAMKILRESAEQVRVGLGDTQYKFSIL